MITPIIPEIILIISACAALLADAIRYDPKHQLAYGIVQLGLVLAIIVMLVSPTETMTLFNDTFIIDQMSIVLKVFICVISVVVFVYSYDYMNTHDWLVGEYFVLGLFAVIGMMVMVSAYNLITIYLGLELISLSLYAMVAINRNSKLATEAAMKYFVLGAIASGILLYGMSFIYGITGTLQLDAIVASISTSPDPQLLTYGLVFIIVAIAFKLGVVPFHMWLPDVYQGAPTSVTLFISTTPKIAAFAMLIRLLVDGLFPIVEEWQSILMVLAILSISLGNIIAIAQSNIKRMLAYSTIAHMGYLLLGMVSATESGFAAAMFYSVMYAIMSLGAFGILILVGHKDYDVEKIEDLKGLATRSPWFSFIMLCIMFSMAGVPPFIGFWSKWFVFKELIAVDMFNVAIIAIIFSIIGAYYYLRVIKYMFFDEFDHSIGAIQSSKIVRYVLSINGIVILLFGLLPDYFMQLCRSVMLGHI